MNKDANQLFPFNEQSEITCKLQLYHNGHSESIVQDASIMFEGKNLVMCLELNSAEKAHLLTREYKKKHYRMIGSSTNGYDIKLQLDGMLRFTRLYQLNGKKYISMPLNKVTYSYNGHSQHTCYRLSSVASELLMPYFTDFTTNDNIVVGTHPIDYSGLCFNKAFSLFNDEQNVYLQTEEDISDILSVLSFFFCSPIEYDMKHSYDSDDKCNVDVYIPKYKVVSADRNDILGYLFSDNQCLDNLYTFLQITSVGEHSCGMSEMLVKYIDYYVRAEYLDNISKLLIYDTILEKMAGVEKDAKNAYTEIHKFLKGKHIDVDKINCQVGSKRMKYKEKEEDTLIDNFVKLRNFFVHHLGSKEAENFLKESDMLFYLKMAVTILIIEQMGIEKIEFDKRFHEISIFDDTIEERDTFSTLSNGN